MLNRFAASLPAILLIPCLVLAQEQAEPASNRNLTLPKIAGKELYQLKQCGACHTLNMAADGKLTPLKTARDQDWMETHIAENSELVLRREESRRKQRRVLRDEAAALAAWLFETSESEKKQIDTMPQNVYQGAYAAYQNKCINCHSIAGAGRDIGPDLSKIGTKHDKKWFIANFIDPKQFAKDTEMPSFKDLPEETLSKMADYLLTLK